MKKYASLLAVFVLLLGFAASAYSVPAEIPADTTAAIAKGKTQVTLGGELRYRGWYGKNLDLDTKGDGDNTAYYDYRVRLNLEAKVSPNTTGFIEIQGSSGLTSDTADWGSVNTGGRGVYNIGNTLESTVFVRQAWVLYQGTGLLGVPAGIKVGRQPIKLGYGLFYDHTFHGDDAILAFVQPVKELTLAGYTIKWWEGRGNPAHPIPFHQSPRNYNDDSTGYGILAAYAGKGFGLSADITYVDHQNLPVATIPGTPAGLDIHLWNIGLRGNVDNIAGTGLNFKADVEFQTGKVKDIAPAIRLGGWAFMAGLDYKFKDIPLSLTLEYAIGSGDKAGTANKVEAFITAVGQEPHYTFIYEHASNMSACNFLNNNRTGLCNTQYVKFGGAYDITKDLKAELYGFWLRAHQPVAINDPTGAFGVTPSKDIGWEVDAKLTYKLDKGLDYWIDAAYFSPGKAFKVNPTTDADDAWALRHGLQLRF